MGASGSAQALFVSRRSFESHTPTRAAGLQAQIPAAPAETFAAAFRTPRLQSLNMLNPAILQDREQIRIGLRQPLLVVKNALIPEQAERLYRDLLNSSAWTKQNYKTGDYAFQRDIINMESANAPASLRELYACLSGDEMKQWFAHVSGRRCDAFTAAATLYRQGDRLTEHNDRYIYEEPGKPRYVRALTFNYYLCKRWDPQWGGNFVWREPYQRVSPDFNTLVLFNVTTNSHHWVEPVTSHTDVARLSVTGWYLSEVKPERYQLSV